MITVTDLFQKQFSRRRVFYRGAGFLLLTVALGSVASRGLAMDDAMTADSIKAAGHAVAALVAKRDAKSIFARFTPEMANAVTEKNLQEVLDQAISDRTPLGDLVSENVRSEGDGSQAYVGEYRWRTDRNMTLSVSFAPGGTEKILGLRLIPGPTDRPNALRIGRSLVGIIASGDAKAIEAHFTPELVAKLPEDQLKRVLDSLFTDKTPLGPLKIDAIEDAGSGYLRYSAEHTWNKDNDQPLNIILSIESGGDKRIAAIFLRPGTPGKLPPDPRAGYVQKTTLHLPFAHNDAWYVFWGGNTIAQNYHVVAPDQRHAFDLLAMKSGKTHDGDGQKLEQYYAWGRSIVAPADGTVVEAVNDLPDNPIGQTDATHATGNHVLIDLGNGEYALLAHMQKGSVSVTAGQKVRMGDVLGKCGNSGNTSEPHLHFHLQDKPYLFKDALGLPVTFTDYVSNGKAVASGSPVKGETIHLP